MVKRDARKSFGKNLLERRLALRLSQEELAERADLHRTYVGSVERGERNVSLGNIVRLANALKVKPSDLLKGVEE
jgi:transcriptional regulator with XRE-family HTH domain